MITEVYFIEVHYLYTLVGSSGRGELTSERGAAGAPERHAGTCQRDTSKESAKGAWDWWQLLEKIAR